MLSKSATSVQSKAVRAISADVNHEGRALRVNLKISSSGHRMLAKSLSLGKQYPKFVTIICE